jgi:hypothetical protein
VNRRRRETRERLVSPTLISDERKKTKPRRTTSASSFCMVRDSVRTEVLPWVNTTREYQTGIEGRERRGCHSAPKMMSFAIVPANDRTRKHARKMRGVVNERKDKTEADVVISIERVHSRTKEVTHT